MIMEKKIVQFEKNENRYIKLADEKIASGDLLGALGFLFSALAINDSAETLMDIADVYSQMSLYELSNKYWFYFMEKAPKEKVSIAYEELAINFFYMDDFLASGYYFHQKLAVDGFVTREGLDQEIIDFFSGEETKDNSYYIAYPYERADYSYVIKKGKRALSIGNFNEAIRIFKTIPAECLDEESAGELAIAYLMNDQPDFSVAVARESLAIHGDNVTALCNLSNVYDFKEDVEKSKYYYDKALACAKGAKNEEYKLVTCAIERSDHKTVKTCLEKILTERPYDVVMQFFYGIALLNCGEKEGARYAFYRAYRLDPKDKIYKFYAQYATKVCREDYNGENYLPLRYLKKLPSTVEESYKKKIKELVSNPNKVSFALKKAEFREVVEWGVYYGEKLARECVFILATAFTPYAKKLLRELLMDSELDTSVKQVIVYALIVDGYKERFNVVDRNFFLRLKAKKVVCEREEDGGIYLSAYGLAFSRLAFLGIEKLDKLSGAINNVYARFKGVISEAEVTNEEIAALAVSICKIPGLEKEEEIMRVFEIKKQKLQLLTRLYKGEKI